MRVFENRVLSRIFGPKRDWRKLQNAELNYLYSSPNIVPVIKSRRMRWARFIANMWERNGAYRVLVGKPTETRSHGRPRHRWEYKY
jgi:7-keto-8-aminopelargonate synthetase-like enzyme